MAIYDSQYTAAQIDEAIGAIPDKQDKMGIVSAGSSALSAAANTYYKFSSNVGTLTVTLPSVSDNTKVTTVVLSFTTGSSPNVTLTASGGATISYFADYAIEANTSYEINCLWNGQKWIVAYGVIE